MYSMKNIQIRALLVVALLLPLQAAAQTPRLVLSPNAELTRLVTQLADSTAAMSRGRKDSIRTVFNALNTFEKEMQGPRRPLPPVRRYESAAPDARGHLPLATKVTSWLNSIQAPEQELLSLTSELKVRLAEAVLQNSGVEAVAKRRPLRKSYQPHSFRLGNLTISHAATMQVLDTLLQSPIFRSAREQLDQIESRAHLKQHGIDLAAACKPKLDHYLALGEEILIKKDSLFRMKLAYERLVRAVNAAKDELTKPEVP